MLATTSVSFAATPIEIGPVQGQAGNGVAPPNRLSDLFSIAMPGLYDFTLTVGPHSSGAVGGTMTAQLLKIVSSSLSQVISTISVTVTNGGTNSLTDQLTLASGDYRIRWSTSGVNNGTIEGTASIAAVPGPEAGAGLGALAMASVVFWMKRRRKDDALAA